MNILTIRMLSKKAKKGADIGCPMLDMAFKILALITLAMFLGIIAIITMIYVKVCC